MNHPQLSQCRTSLAVGPFTINENLYRADQAQPRHAHGKGGITLVLAGSLEESVGRGSAHARALSMVVKPLDTEHANRFGSGGAHTIQIRIDEDAAAGGSLRGWRWHHCDAAVREFIAVLRCVRARDLTATQVAIYDLLAAVSQSHASSGAPPRWLLDVCAHIDDLLPGTVRVQEVALAADVHPVYLARQFRRFFGGSVTQYIAARRAQHAARFLADPRAGLAAAAFHAGYADQSHMTRAFRSTTGVTPRALQRLIAG